MFPLSLQVETKTWQQQNQNVVNSPKQQEQKHIYRPLNDGDIIFMNKSHSIQKHSLIAQYVKFIPITSILSINPLCCSSFCRDFDGDCLHGYIPQSIDIGVEISELVALYRQLIN